MHSPAWSQIGQSSGWLISRNSITARSHSLVFSDCVKTTIPSATAVLQAITGLGNFSTSTRQIRQLPAIESAGW